jgi:hypothetical protein
MGNIDRTFRLTNEPGGLGLNCSPLGLSLAGIPLLRKSEDGFAPRSIGEVEALIEAAYGTRSASAELMQRLGRVAGALNKGELAYAMTVAVLGRLPELDWNGAARLARAEQRLRKYNPNEARDWRGRWTDDGGADASGQDRPPEYLTDAGSEEGTVSQQPLVGSSRIRDLDADDDEPPDDRPALERRYDDLGPVAFAEQVIQFGDRLGRQAGKLTPEELSSARAEYDFLQDRLSFWFGYSDKPFESQAKLISAAQTLYEGAINGGIISVRDGFPSSMLDVALGLVGQDNHQPEIKNPGSLAGSLIEREPLLPEEQSFGALSDATEASRIGRVGDIIDSDVAGIDFDHGIGDKGLPLEGYIAAQAPGIRILKPGSKTFDLMYDLFGQAISAKVLDPLCYSYIKNPQRIYYRIRSYVNAAAKYDRPRTKDDLDPSEIKSRVIHLGVRNYISPSQWQQLNRAVIYGRSRGVSVVITRIR